MDPFRLATRAPSTKRAKSGFSLVELIAVMVIMVVLLVWALPAAVSAIRASRLTDAASTVSGELRFARYHALAHRRYVAVLMPTAQASDAGGVDDADYKAHAIRCCYLTGAPTYDSGEQAWHGVFDDYVEDRSWRFLPDGVFVGYTDTHGTYGTSAASCACNVVEGVAFPEAVSSERLAVVRAVIFAPDGRAVAAPTGQGTTTDTRILVLPGILRTSTELRAVDGGSSAFAMTVRHYSGKVVFDE